MTAIIDKEIPNDICCVCGHNLGNHLDEGDVWRCHNLGQDWYQCECALRKGRVIEKSLDIIEQYDLKKRMLQYIDEEPEDFKKWILEIRKEEHK